MTVHIISHTHWDREWFLNSPFTNEWLLPFFDSLFAMLEKEKDYRFVLDGQTLIIEDWLAELEKNGEKSLEYLKKLKQYTAEKRILIGPYYIQPDWQLVSGEALIRNLLIGSHLTKEFNAPLSVGWLLDNFGQISQAVQIHKGFGLKGLFLWRGISLEPKAVHTEFCWQSPDGSALTAIYLIDSYRNAMRFSENTAIFKQRLINEVEKLKPFLTTSQILLLNGYDQEMQPDDVLPLIRSYSNSKLDLQQSTPEEYIRAVEAEKPFLKMVKGALYSGRYISVFPGVLSSRIYLKVTNERCQRLLERYLEPFQSISWLTGGKYNQKAINNLLKTLLKNHPHDNICGVSIDDVHSDMEKRFSGVIAKINHKLEDIFKHIVTNIDTNRKQQGEQIYCVFNPSFTERDFLITVQAGTEINSAIDTNGDFLPMQKGDSGLLNIHISSVPALGYKIIFLKKSICDTNLPKFEAIKVFDIEKSVENRFFKILFNSDGTFSVHSKINGSTWQGLGVFEDSADAGDTYNYSPLANAALITNKSSIAKISFQEKGPLRCTIQIQIVLQVPEGLNIERTERSSQLVELPIISYITIEANSPLIRCRTVLKNTAKDHRLRVLFPTNIETDFSKAETQFDVTEHPIQPKSQDIAEISPELKRVMIGARECGPITTFAQQSFVNISDKTRGFSVLNLGLPEYEICGKEKSIALTLFRSVGWLARADLQSRIGDAGPLVRTPEAQCLRNMEFHYALYLHNGDWLEGQVYAQSEYYKIEPVVIETGKHKGSLPARYSFVSLKSEKDLVRVSTFKRAEDGNGLILRCYNIGKKKIKAVICLSYKLITVWRTDFKEEPQNREKINKDNKCSFWVNPKEICTLKLIIDNKIKLPVEKCTQGKVVKSSQIPIKPQIDFSKVKTVPVITPEDIIEEENRIKSLIKDLQAAQKQKNKIGEKYRKEALIATFERSILEAKLSTILCKKKYIELNPGQTIYTETEQEIRMLLKKIGLELNNARIKKRTLDYLAENEVNLAKSVN